MYGGYASKFRIVTSLLRLPGHASLAVVLHVPANFIIGYLDQNQVNRALTDNELIPFTDTQSQYVSLPSHHHSETHWLRHGLSEHGFDGRFSAINRQYEWDTVLSKLNTWPVSASSASPVFSVFEMFNLLWFVLLLILHSRCALARVSSQDRLRGRRAPDDGISQLIKARSGMVPRGEGEPHVITPKIIIIDLVIHYPFYIADRAVCSRRSRMAYRSAIGQKRQSRRPQSSLSICVLHSRL